MCEFCLKHGEGRRWYLEAKNYSEDLLSDLRRREFIADFTSHPDVIGQTAAKMPLLDRAPGFVRRTLAWRVSRRYKKMHFGQVVPIEDIERILGFTNSVVRVACICRYATRGIDARYCYGVSMGPQGGVFGDLIADSESSYLKGPDGVRMESLSKEEALELMRAHEREGLCHSVWTFITPFIGGICNCDRTDCMAMRATLSHGMRVMFRAEYVAQADPDCCIGCRACMRICQFGAMGHSAARSKVEIDPKRCFGCGSCRSVCAQGAIVLKDRRDVESARNLW